MVNNYHKQNWVVTRRVFLKASAAILAAPALTSFSCMTLTGSKRKPGSIRFGIVTDCHYADADTIGSRYYRHSLDKLAESTHLILTVYILSFSTPTTNPMGPITTTAISNGQTPISPPPSCNG